MAAPEPQGAAGAAGGVLLTLSEQEQKWYSELYSHCQADSSGKAAAASKVADLFRASQLPADTLHQVTELCGAKRLGYFGHGQFYVALKLIAAAQSGLPVRLDRIKSELRLPRFVAMKNESEVRYGTPSQSSEAHGHLCQIPRTVLDKNSLLRADSVGEKQDSRSPPLSPLSSPPASPSTYQRTPLSYGYGKTRSGIEQKNVGAYEGRQAGHPVLQQDAPTSVNYGSKPSLVHSSATQSHPIEREPHGNGSDYSDDPWRITEEQQEYYTNQFKTLQPDLSSFISGTVAKNFFTKSKLSIPELSHIWELSDVDCDGALTLPEFCAAFHLIVARKNGYLLPDTLPQSLQPEHQQSLRVSPKPVLEGSLHASYSDSPPVGQQAKDGTCKEQLEPVSEDPANLEPLILFDVDTTIAELACASRSGISALKPYKEPEKSSAERMPEKNTQEQNLKPTAEKQDANLEVDSTVKTRTRQRSYSSASIDDAMKKTEEPPTPPPRPQKAHSRASSLDLNKIFQQSHQAPTPGWLPPPPPALPPRPPGSQLTRHSSIEPAAQTQPAVQQASFADFSKFKEQNENVSKVELQPQLNKATNQGEENSLLKKDAVPSQPPSKPVRRKLRPESQVLENQELSSSLNATSSPPGTKPHSTVQKQPSKQKKAIQTAIRKNKEANAVLVRLNSELQQQLKDCTEQEALPLEIRLAECKQVVQKVIQIPPKCTPAYIAVYL
nr:PREDICTED: ralBP1-associated Eps domain-containing protein 2 [Latimeria chalumnae]|eukprot:XP_006000814.1 PREDICTED: ralBP1-associated Eps domain-containing protein 2 [Latimeria chalumnae]